VSAPAPPGGSAARIFARGIALPVLAGAACVLGFAPFYWWPIPAVALAALFFVWGTSGSPLQAALSGYAFGLGVFLAGVSWVFVSLNVYGAMPAVLAALATFLFCAYLALFPALAGAAAVGLARRPGWPRSVAMVAAFVAFEWLRGVRAGRCAGRFARARALPRARRARRAVRGGRPPEHGRVDFACGKSRGDGAHPGQRPPARQVAQ